MSTPQPTVEILSHEPVVRDFVSVDRYTLRHQNFDGTWTEPYSRCIFTVGLTGTAAAALPYDPVQDTVILIEQFRLPVYLRQQSSGWFLETVAGLIPEGKTAEDTARLEVEEEAGCPARRMEFVAKFFGTPGSVTETFDMYIAEVDAGEHGRVHGLAHEQENTRVHVLSVKDAIALADSGKIEDGKTLLVLNWFARHHTAIRERWLKA